MAVVPSPKTLPSLIQYNYAGGLTVQWGCVLHGDITVSAHAARESFPGREVVISSVPSTSSSAREATLTARPKLSALSSSPSVTATEAAAATHTQKPSHGNGLNTASEVGSVLGAVFAALAVAVAIYFGVREVRKRRMQSIVQPAGKPIVRPAASQMRRAPTV